MNFGNMIRYGTFRCLPRSFPSRMSVRLKETSTNHELTSSFTTPTTTATNNNKKETSTYNRENRRPRVSRTGLDSTPLYTNSKAFEAQKKNLRTVTGWAALGYAFCGYQCFRYVNPESYLIEFGLISAGVTCFAVVTRWTVSWQVYQMTLLNGSEVQVVYRPTFFQGMKQRTVKKEDVEVVTVSVSLKNKIHNKILEEPTYVLPNNTALHRVKFKDDTKQYKFAPGGTFHKDFNTIFGTSV